MARSKRATSKPRPAGGFSQWFQHKDTKAQRHEERPHKMVLIAAFLRVFVPLCLCVETTEGLVEFRGEGGGVDVHAYCQRRVRVPPNQFRLPDVLAAGGHLNRGLFRLQNRAIDQGHGGKRIPREVRMCIDVRQSGLEYLRSDTA